MPMSSRTVISAETASGAPQINPWLIGVVVSLAAFMEVLDTSIANVALSHIASSIGASNFELEITERTLETRKQSLQLTETLERGGSGTLADVFPAEQLLYTAAAAIPDFERQIEQEENSISILLGRNPGPIVREASEMNWPQPEQIPTGIPSQLLEHRPDIQQAEAELVAVKWRCWSS
jgi:outer membrane protein, multidrug efflux system